MLVVLAAVSVVDAAGEGGLQTEFGAAEGAHIGISHRRKERRALESELLYPIHIKAKHLIRDVRYNISHKISSVLALREHL